MRLTELSVAGYRSLVDVRLDLAPLTVVHGVNGSGKSNLLRAASLLRAAAEGRLAAEVVAEGGLPRIAFADARRGAKGGEPPVRVRLGASIAAPTDAGDVALRYDIALGIPAVGGAFALDPEIKEERVELRVGRRPTVLMDRAGTTTLLTDDAGRRAPHPVALRPSVTALAGLVDQVAMPEAALVARALRGVCVRAPVEVGPTSPARGRSPATRTGRMSADGRDLAAAIATTRYEAEVQHHAFIAACFEALGAHIDIAPSAEDDAPTGWADIIVGVPDLGRPLRADELSDGQLRFLAVAALATAAEPPTLLALDEPEASLAERAIDPLARLLADASKRTGVLVVTHSDRLTQGLMEAGAEVVIAERVAGATRIRAA